jgi:small basic protein
MHALHAEAHRMLCGVSTMLEVLFDGQIFIRGFCYNKMDREVNWSLQ